VLAEPSLHLAWEDVVLSAKRERARGLVQNHKQIEGDFADYRIGEPNASDAGFWDATEISVGLDIGHGVRLFDGAARRPLGKAAHSRQVRYGPGQRRSEGTGPGGFEYDAQVYHPAHTLRPSRGRTRYLHYQPKPCP